MPSLVLSHALARRFTRRAPTQTQQFTYSRGQGLVEYGLIIVLVALVVVGTLALLGPDIHAALAPILNALKQTVGPSPTTPPIRK